jgi:hypothetical protein
LTAGATFAFVSACSLVTGTSDDDEEALRDAQIRWNNSRIQDYRVVVQHLCFCGYARPVLVVVQAGVIVLSADAETGEPVPSYATVRDIPALFTLIREAIDQGADRLDVKYDPQIGYPREIKIDYVSNATDDELTVTTSELRPLR